MKTPSIPKEERVSKMLQHSDTHEFLRPHGIHPRVLRRRCKNSLKHVPSFTSSPGLLSCPGVPV